jgi:hypothetical protein
MAAERTIHDSPGRSLFIVDSPFEADSYRNIGFSVKPRGDENRRS